MTEKVLVQANRIKNDLDLVTQAKRDIMTYHNERLELDVKIKKGLMNLNADDSTTRHFTVYSHSPLFIAIASALEGMREELIDQLDKLDSNKEPENVVHPITKTSWFKKAFSWAIPK